MFGGPNDTFSFLHMAHRMFLGGETLRAATDWAAHTTHSFYVARALLALLERKTYGIYHTVSPGVPTYLEIAQYLAGQMGVPPKLIQPSTRQEIGLAAGRPKRLELSIKMWIEDFGAPLPDWKKGIADFVAERKPSARSAGPKNIRAQRPIKH